MVAIEPTTVRRVFQWYTGIFLVHWPDGYAKLMSLNKGETVVHGCHCPGDMAVHMREVLLRSWAGVCVPLALSLSYSQKVRSHHKILSWQAFTQSRLYINTSFNVLHVALFNTIKTFPYLTLLCYKIFQWKTHYLRYRCHSSPSWYENNQKSASVLLFQQKCLLNSATHCREDFAY